jgi:chromosome segregation ATPase
MTTAVAFSKADLDQVFDEVKNAQTDIDDKTSALHDAEQKAAAVKGLTTAAQHALRNSEANLQLLELAKDEAESKNAEYASISAQLEAVSAELTQANARRAAVEQAREAIREIKTALQEWVSTAGQATTTAFQASVSAVDQLRITPADKENTTGELQKHHNTLNTSLGKLRRLEDRHLNNADQQLEKSAPSAAQIAELEGKNANLVSQRNKVKKPDKAPDLRQIQLARAGVEAAKTAAAEAPGVERDRLAMLKLARENLTTAQDRLTDALVAKDAAERSWIEGIDMVGPGADGVVIAKAKLVSATLPEGYSLEWTFDGVPVQSEPPGGREGYIRFNTKGMASGSYAITVHLHRD